MKSSIYYPEGLPNMSVWGFGPYERRAASDIKPVTPNFRKREGAFRATSPIAWVYNLTQMRTFVAWYETDLEQSGKWWQVYAPFPGDEPWSWLLVRFINKPNWVALGNNNWKVTAEVELYGLGAAPDDLPPFDPDIIWRFSFETLGALTLFVNEAAPLDENRTFTWDPFEGSIKATVASGTVLNNNPPLTGAALLQNTANTAVPAARYKLVDIPDRWNVGALDWDMYFDVGPVLQNNGIAPLFMVTNAEDVSVYGARVEWDESAYPVVRFFLSDDFESEPYELTGQLPNADGDNDELSRVHVYRRGTAIKIDVNDINYDFQFINFDANMANVTGGQMVIGNWFATETDGSPVSFDNFTFAVVPAEETDMQPTTSQVMWLTSFEEFTLGEETPIDLQYDVPGGGTANYGDAQFGEQTGGTGIYSSGFVFGQGAVLGLDVGGFIQFEAPANSNTTELTLEFQLFVETSAIDTTPRGTFSYGGANVLLFQGVSGVHAVFENLGGTLGSFAIGDFDSWHFIQISHSDLGGGMHEVRVYVNNTFVWNYVEEDASPGALSIVYFSGEGLTHAAAIKVDEVRVSNVGLYTTANLPSDAPTTTTLPYPAPLGP